jgi:mRNA interferase RelE/StbE
MSDGREGWRLRVGDWRVLLDIDENARTIKVLRVLPRGRAYER